MRVSKIDIERTIEKLEELLAEMEAHNQEEVETESNTYYCGSEFISYGRNGYLDIDQAIENIYNQENTDE